LKSDDYATLEEKIKECIMNSSKIKKEQRKILREAVMKEFKDNNISLFQDIMKCIEEAASKDEYKDNEKKKKNIRFFK
jgi:hypothetical protein